jgi:hypothetical protein
MKQETKKILDTELTLERLPMLKRADFKSRLVEKVGGVIDLGLLKKGSSLDTDLARMTVEAITKLAGSGGLEFMVNIAKESVVAPPTLSRDRTYKEFMASMDEWESEHDNDGFIFIAKLFMDSVYYQEKGIVEAVGKRFGISAKKIADTFLEALT